MTRNLFHRSVAAALCALLLSGLPAPAQERFRDWQVTRGAGGCVATIDVGLKAPSSGLVSVAVLARRDAADVPAVMMLRVPLGAALAAGIAYSHPHSDAAVGLAWQYCDDATCLASGGVTAAELARLKRGRRIFVAFQPLAGSRPLIVPVSLLGFTRAWGAVQDCD